MIVTHKIRRRKGRANYVSRLSLCAEDIAHILVGAYCSRDMDPSEISADSSDIFEIVAASLLISGTSVALVDKGLAWTAEHPEEFEGLVTWLDVGIGVRKGGADEA